MPNPSYSLLEASSRGERGISLEDEERGVVGEELDAADLTEEPEDWVSPSLSSAVVSMETVGKGWETAALKRRGCGLNLGPDAEIGDTGPPAGGGDTRSVGGVILTLGEETARLPLRTELLFPPRLQDDAESDLEGAAVAWMLLDAGLPKEVPPLMTVVRFGVGGGSDCSSKRPAWELRLVVRLPNLPPRAAVMGT